MSLFQNDRRQSLIACASIALLALAAYSNSFSGPFIFDDTGSIEKNETIRSLWPPWPVLAPREGAETVAGRPILNLSFALNYAAGELEVWGYHAVNLAIHILAGWILFALLRHTLLLPVFRGRYGEDGWLIALAISTLWTLHPMQTESVTYIVQRAESLVGLVYLLTLYCFARGCAAGASQAWLWASVAACAIGMGCKEVMASAPLVALLYDRTFVAGTFAEAWRRRRPVYLAMASTWLLLAYFVWTTGNRGGSAGLTVGMSPLAYLLTQGCAIFEYLRLSFWPTPLILDYGTTLVTDPARFAGPVLLVVALAVATVFGVWRNKAAGFLGFCFFALLAPSSSFIPVASQTMAVHRMYLPLATVIILVIVSLYKGVGLKGLLLAPILAALLGWLTFERNRDYRSELVIWSDTVLKCPGSARALGNLGTVLVRLNRFEMAEPLLLESLRLDGGNAKVLSNYGIVLFAGGAREEGLKHFQAAYQIDPDGEYRDLNMGVALVQMGRNDEARAYLEKALTKDPQSAAAARRQLEAMSEGGKATPSFEPVR